MVRAAESRTLPRLRICMPHGREMPECYRGRARLSAVPKASPSGLKARREGARRKKSRMLALPWKSGASAPRKQFEINERFSACAVEMDTQRVFPQPLSAMPGSSQFGQRASARQNQPFPIELPIPWPFNGTAEAVPFQIEHSIQSREGRTSVSATT